MTETTKAKITQVPVGNLSIEGLKLPDGSYAVAVSQLPILFPNSVTQNNATRQAKTLAGKDSPLLKIKSELNSRAVNYISLIEFEKVLRVLDKKGDKDAELIMDALIGLSLTQLWADAFDDKCEQEERQAYIKQRQRGKVSRRGLTDSIMDYMDRHDVSDNYRKFIFANCSDYLNKIILGAKAKQAKEFYQLPKNSLLRNHIPQEALRELELTEALAGRLIDERDMEPLEAVKSASATMFTKFVGMD